MAQRFTQQQLEERYEKLPQTLREAMFSAELAEKMYEIGRRNGLNIEKTGILSEETGYVILGLTRPQEYVGFLAERLGVAPEKAGDIAREVNHEIFSSLHEALKAAHQIDIRDEDLKKGEAPITRPVPAAPSRAPRDTTQEKIAPSPDSAPIDLRSQYRPRATEPPSKIPAINLREQKKEALHMQTPQQQQQSAPQPRAPHAQPTPPETQKPPESKPQDFTKKMESVATSPFQITIPKKEPPTLPTPPGPPHISIPVDINNRSKPLPPESFQNSAPPPNIPLQQKEPEDIPPKAEQKPPAHPPPKHDPYREPIND